MSRRGTRCVYSYILVPRSRVSRVPRPLTQRLLDHSTRCLTVPATPAFCINTGSPSPPRQPDNSFSCIQSFSVHFQTLCSLAPCVPCTSYLRLRTSRYSYTTNPLYELRFGQQYIVPQVSTLDLDRQGITTCSQSYKYWPIKFFVVLGIKFN